MVEDDDNDIYIYIYSRASGSWTPGPRTAVVWVWEMGYSRERRFGILQAGSNLILMGGDRGMEKKEEKERVGIRLQGAVRDFNATKHQVANQAPRTRALSHPLCLVSYNNSWGVWIDG